MSVKHHPSDATLIAYGAGSLGEGLSLVVATHLSYCAECRQRVQEIETLGGVLLEELPPADVADDALDRLLQRLDDPVPAEQPRPAAPAAPPGALVLPAPLNDYVGPVSEDRWRRLVPGIRQIEVLPQRRGEGTVRLLRIAPGTALPSHGHGGAELTLVLSGSFSDETGRFEAGDVGELDSETEHQPIADAEVDCICLVATEAPLRFRGLLPRLMQPFLRF